ncbi:MAG: SseB family protein [Rhodobacteraceae bacterium]|nr:SseB family protein [Paracoccaceae bacterium]
MSETPLDQAHLAAEADPDQRLRFFDRLAGAELFLLLERDEPKVFELSDGPIVLAFDTEARLAEFAPAGAERAEITGRSMVAMLAGQGVGLGLNLSVAPSSQILGPDALDWLAGMLDQGPAEVSGRPKALRAPGRAPEALLRALDEKLSAAAGLADAAYLAEADWDNGASGHLLAVIGAPDGARNALTRAVGEALVFSGIEAGAVDVSFHHPGDPVVATLERVGLRFDLPQLGLVPTMPGRDPSRPPKLR